MNKKINKSFNVFEMILVFLILSCFGLLFIIDMGTIDLGSASGMVNVYKNILIITCFISSILIISIELFIFILLKMSYKILYISYIILDIIICVWFNSKLPFIGINLLFVFCILKNVFRIIKIDKIYIPNEFKRYCKMFNIKLKNNNRKRKVINKNVIVVDDDLLDDNKNTVVSKNKKVVAISKNTRKSKKESEGKTAKSYA